MSRSKARILICDDRKRTHTRLFSFFVAVLLISITLEGIQQAEARTETMLDTTNSNLEISIESPDDWNSGTISEMIPKLTWRLQSLNAINDEGSAIFAVANLPSLANLALPLGQKTGILSIILSQYVTVNEEYDMALSDGSSAHAYSISATGDQLRKVNIPINEGIDAVLITTQQGSNMYIIAYATHMGRMIDFDHVFSNIFNSVRFGSVGFVDSQQSGKLVNPSGEIESIQIGKNSTDPEFEFDYTPTGPGKEIEPGVTEYDEGWIIKCNKIQNSSQYWNQCFP